MVVVAGIQSPSPPITFLCAGRDREFPGREPLSCAVGPLPGGKMPLLGRKAQSRMLLGVLWRAGSHGGVRTTGEFRKSREWPEGVLEGDGERGRSGFPRGGDSADASLIFYVACTAIVPCLRHSEVLHFRTLPHYTIPLGDPELHAYRE
jgi:hypothetical protein